MSGSLPELSLHPQLSSCIPLHSLQVLEGCNKVIPCLFQTEQTQSSQSLKPTSLRTSSRNRFVMFSGFVSLWRNTLQTHGTLWVGDRGQPRLRTVPGTQTSAEELLCHQAQPTLTLDWPSCNKHSLQNHQSRSILNTSSSFSPWEAQKTKSGENLTAGQRCRSATVLQPTGQGWHWHSSECQATPKGTHLTFLLL